MEYIFYFHLFIKFVLAVFIQFMFFREQKISFAKRIVKSIIKRQVLLGQKLFVLELGIIFIGHSPKLDILNFVPRNLI